MKKIALLPLLIIVLFQSSCDSYKNIYRSSYSSLNKGSEIINTLKRGDIIKVGLKNGKMLRVTFIMHNKYEKKVYGSWSRNPKSNANIIIRLEDIEYVKLGKVDGLKTGMMLLIFLVLPIYLISQINLVPCC